MTYFTLLCLPKPLSDPLCLFVQIQFI